MCRWDTELHGSYRSALKDKIHGAMSQDQSGYSKGCARTCYDKCRQETEYNEKCEDKNAVSMADIFQVCGAMAVAMSKGPNMVHEIEVCPRPSS